MAYSSGTRLLRTAAQSAAAGAILTASVSFTGAASLGAQASRVQAAAVAYTGRASLAASAVEVRAAALSFVGRATLATSPARVLVAAEADTAAAQFAASASVIRAAQLSTTGRAALAAIGAVVRSAAVSVAGQALFGADAQVIPPASGAIVSASVSFGTASRFDGAATLVPAAPTGDVTPAMPPMLGGFAPARRSTPDPAFVIATVEMRAGARFEARATLIAAPRTHGARVAFSGSGAALLLAEPTIVPDDEALMIALLEAA
jgi:hypothetical protein